MSAKILINGKAGVGKTNLYNGLPETFVISRDGKAFPFKMPHMLIPTYYGMDIAIHGGEIKTEDGDEYIEGVMDKLEKYNERFGELMDRLMPQWRLYREELKRRPLAHEDWRY